MFQSRPSITSTLAPSDLSNSAPPDVAGAGAAGISNLAARGDHTHGGASGGAFKYAAPTTDYPTIQDMIDAMALDGVDDANPNTGVLLPAPFTENVTLKPGITLSVLGGKGASLTGDVTMAFASAGQATIDGLTINGHLLFGGTHAQQLYLRNSPVNGVDAAATVQATNTQAASSINFDDHSGIAAGVALAVVVNGANSVIAHSYVVGDPAAVTVTVTNGPFSVIGPLSELDGGITISNAPAVIDNFFYTAGLATAATVNTPARLSIAGHIDSDAATTYGGDGEIYFYGPATFHATPVFASTLTLTGQAVTSMSLGRVNRVGQGSAPDDAARIQDLTLYFPLYAVVSGGSLLPAYDYADGVITFKVAGAVAPDTTVPGVGDLIVLPFTAPQAVEDSGLYVVTVPGDGSHQAVWTRIAQMPHGGVLHPYAVFINKGANAAHSLFFQTSTGTIGVTSPSFSEERIHALQGDVDGATYAVKNVGSMTLGSSSSNAHAVLYLDGVTKGLRLNSLTAGEETTLAGLLGAGDEPLMIYNKTTHKIRVWTGAAFADAPG